MADLSGNNSTIYHMRKTRIDFNPKRSFAADQLNKTTAPGSTSIFNNPEAINIALKNSMTAIQQYLSLASSTWL